MGDFQFLFIDLIIILTIAFTSEQRGDEHQIIIIIFFQSAFKEQLSNDYILSVSESKPSLEGAGVASPAIQSDLRPAALLSPDPDPHLPGLPGPGFSPGTTAELVRDMDASVRVSNVDLFI